MSSFAHSPPTTLSFSYPSHPLAGLMEASRKTLTPPSAPTTAWSMMCVAYEDGSPRWSNEANGEINGWILPCCSTARKVTDNCRHVTTRARSELWEWQLLVDCVKDKVTRASHRRRRVREGRGERKGPRQTGGQGERQKETGRQTQRKFDQSLRKSESGRTKI